MQLENESFKNRDANSNVHKSILRLDLKNLGEYEMALIGAPDFIFRMIVLAKKHPDRIEIGRVSFYHNGRGCAFVDAHCGLTSWPELWIPALIQIVLKCRLCDDLCNFSF